MQGQKHVTRTVSAWRRAQAWSVAWGEGRARALATRCCNLRGIWSSNDRRGVVILLTFTEEGLTGFRLPHPGGYSHPRMRVDVMRPVALFDVQPSADGRLRVKLRNAGASFAQGGGVGHARRAPPAASLSQ